MADERLFQLYREVLKLGIEDLQDVLQAENKLMKASFEITLTLQGKASYQHSQDRQQCLSR